MRLINGKFVPIDRHGIPKPIEHQRNVEPQPQRIPRLKFVAGKFIPLDESSPVVASLQPASCSINLIPTNPLLPVINQPNLEGAY